MAVG
jgi:hypothetical protein